MTSLRLATVEDAQAVATLCDQLGYPTTPEQARLRLLATLPKSDHAIFVAENPAGQVVGWIHLHGTHHLQAEPYAEIGGLVVDEAHHGKGYGKALVEQGEAWAMSQGYSLLRVRSNVRRTPAHTFYQARGYTLHKSQHAFIKKLAPS